MVVVMEERASEEQIEKVVSRLVEMGMDVHRSTGVTRTVLGAVGRGHPDKGLIEMLPGVHEVLRISEPYKLASRTFKPEGTVVSVGDVRIGGDEVIVMAGPCSAETEKQVRDAAAAVRRAGAKIFRGGAFKPRSSPYSFQGLGEEGLRLLRDAANAENLKLVTEVMDLSQIEVIEKYADIFQVGARNMQNFTLLRELGHARKPVLLKRGISATIEEWLLSAEYVLSGGNNDVILCERGIRTFETATRNTFDISAIPVVKKLSHLPVIADPSHGAGRRDMVAPMARAAVAAGVDGLIIEVHCDPDHALSDGAQSMFPSQFDRLMAELRIIAPAIGRSICLEPVARRGWGSRSGTMKELPVLQPTRREGAPPIFEKIGIVGLGLIGGSIALKARELWPTSLVIAVDDKDVLETAMRLHAIDVAADDLIVLAEADLVVLAAPVKQNIALLEKLDEYVSKPAIVTDTGSTKREIVAAARALPPRFTFIGGHPLAGAARGGLEHARPDLFAGRPWLLTPDPLDGGRRLQPSAAGTVEKLSSFITALGSTPRTLAVDAHDRLVAFLSHLPQLTASALMQVVGDAVGPEGLALSGRGLADTTRLASSPADIWTDIAATNADEIGQALDALIGVLEELRDDLATGDRLTDVFTAAARWRERLGKSRD